MLLLCLDELGQIHPAAVGEAAYMLGKWRGEKPGEPNGRRPPASAMEGSLFLSTGEISLADKMAEGGKQARAGQEFGWSTFPLMQG